MTAPPSPRPLHEAAEPSLLRVEVIQGTVNPAWPAVVALRERVFGGEQGIAEATASDPDDARSLHAVAWLETSGPVVGSGAWWARGGSRSTTAAATRR
jgi:hypothetical protein